MPILNLESEQATRHIDEINERLPRATPHGAEHPACALQFRSRGQASKYSTFESNLRAIALTLEALRAVDRYGVVEGEQYAGFKQLAAPGTQRPMTRGEAAMFVAAYAVMPHDQVSENAEVREAAYRKAARDLHPDNKQTGDHGLFVKLQEAITILRAGA
jgi:hypothetical protein